MANFGTCKTESKDKVGETLMLHFLEMEENVPLATLTLSLQKLVEYEENNEEKLVIW